MASTLLRISPRSGFGRLGRFLLPGALGRFCDHSFFDGADSDADVADFAVGHHRFDALEVGEKAAFGNGGHVRADTAGFLGFTTAPDDAALPRAFSCQFTNSCHNDFLSKGARETTSE